MTMRSSFTRKLCAHIWSPECLELLSDSGWLDGGCLALARSVVLWARQGEVLAVMEVGRDGTACMQHFVVRFEVPEEGQGGSICFDGSGAWREEDLKRVWHAETGGLRSGDVYLESVSDEEIAREQDETLVGVCFASDHPELLARMLNRKFGEFRDEYLVDLARDALESPAHRLFRPQRKQRSRESQVNAPSV